MSSFIRLPFLFDPAKLEADLKFCLSADWPGHFNTKDYSGKWSSISLRSISGSPTDIRSIPEGKYMDTFLMDSCPYFREILSAFKCETETVRLLNLGAGGIIHEHRDPGAGYHDGFLRIHIPVSTNEKTSMTVGGATVFMKAGECWYANFSDLHSVRNDGDTDRVHLVIDGLRNEWTDEMFGRAGYDFEAEKEKNKRPAEEVLKIIEELRGMNTEVSLKLADQIAAENGLKI